MTTPPELTWEQARAYLNHMGEHVGEWAGIPMPMQDTEMVIHPRYPFAKIFIKEHPKDEGLDQCKEVNHWYDRRGWEVVLWREGDGRLLWARLPTNKISKEIKTLGAATAWDVEAESKALEKLYQLIKPSSFDQYIMTGSFLETSKRSGLTYMFRRLRPTVVIKKDAVADSVRPLCALCLHPIGYYVDSWAGAMVPTDDVIAHLMLMRGDEHLYWRQANQIPIWRPEAGL